jgi:DNA recombination protein RmuC
VDAADRADAEGVAKAGAELERAVRLEAKTICEKYLAPPQTTDFAILFLPTEGLYAEVMRRPGVADELQRTLRVTIAGPSTLSAILNSLQMGFRTLALEKRRPGRRSSGPRRTSKAPRCAAARWRAS